MNNDTRELIEQVTAALKAAGAREVYVFGSAATGDLRPDSDLDLAVSGLPPHRFFGVVGHLHQLASRAVDLVDLDAATPFTRYLREEESLVRVG
jgi:predicted nucleotidyltransferase